MESIFIEYGSDPLAGEQFPHFLLLSDRLLTTARLSYFLSLAKVLDKLF
jgi:hypothetical protein